MVATVWQLASSKVRVLVVVVEVVDVIVETVDVIVVVGVVTLHEHRVLRREDYAEERLDQAEQIRRFEGTEENAELGVFVPMEAQAPAIFGAMEGPFPLQ